MPEPNSSGFLKLKKQLSLPLPPPEPVATEAAGDKIEFLLKAKDPSTTSLFPVASSDLFNKSTAIPGLGSPEPPGVGGGETLVQVVRHTQAHSH